jgi:prepilin-type processing-associated H-X9-DG protein
MKVSISCRGRCRIRAGTTLIEVLVAVSIAALLLAMLVPAVQFARSSSHRMQCVNNERQLCLAISNYAEIYQSLPLLAESGAGSECPETAITRLFPFLELRPVCEIVTTEVSRLSVLECPIDSVLPLVDRPLSYSLNASPGENAGSRAHGPFDEFAGVRISDVVDGMSTTAAISENIATIAEGTEAMAMRNPNRYTWAVFVPSVSAATLSNAQTDSALAERAEQTEMSIRDCIYGPRTFAPMKRPALGQWIGQFGGGTWTYSHWYPPNSPSCAVQGSSLDRPFLLFSRRAASGHAGGLNVGFLDGHVSFIGNQIDQVVWRSLGTRDGNEVVADY